MAAVDKSSNDSDESKSVGQSDLRSEPSTTDSGASARATADPPKPERQDETRAQGKSPFEWLWANVVQISALAQIVGVLVALAVLFYSVVPGDKVAFYQYRQDQADRAMQEAIKRAEEAKEQAARLESTGDEAIRTARAAAAAASEAQSHASKAAVQERQALDEKVEAERRAAQAVLRSRATEQEAIGIRRRTEETERALAQAQISLQVVKLERQQVEEQAGRLKQTHRTYAFGNFLDLAVRACSPDDLYASLPQGELVRQAASLSECMRALLRWRADGSGDAVRFYRDGVLVKGRSAADSAAGAPYGLIWAALQTVNELPKDELDILNGAIESISQTSPQALRNVKGTRSGTIESLGDLVDRAEAQTLEASGAKR